MKLSTKKLAHWKHADQGWVRDLDNACFPSPDLSFENNDEYHWWVVFSGREAVGYAAVRVRKGRMSEFTRCGVLPEHRGKGIQRLLIKARLTWCKRRGIKKVRTYAAPENQHSNANLIAAGFRARRTKTWVYFTKEIA